MTNRYESRIEKMQRDLGITFIHVTHSQDEALALATVGVVMKTKLLNKAFPLIYSTRNKCIRNSFVGGHNILEA